MKLTTFFSLLGLVAAAPSSPNVNRRDETGGDDSKRRLLIGGPGKFVAADFDGSAFSVVGSTPVQPGTAFSWLLYREESSVVYAVDENSNKIHVYSYNPSATGEDVFVMVDCPEGAAGVVHLELNKDGTRMVASAYGSNAIQVWDTSAADSIKLIGDVTSGIPEDIAAEMIPHQAVLHPTKPFFAVNDLGTDHIHVIDAQDTDNYAVIKSVSVEEGCGPRHGVFSTLDGSEHATLYTVVCEKSNKVLSYKLDYADDAINFEFLSGISSYGPNPPEDLSEDAAAGEIIMVSNDIYVSNRLTGEDEDSISHFSAVDDELSFQDSFSSRANNPRMMSFSKDGKFIYVANIENSQGLHAFPRDTDDGTALADSATSADLSSEFADDGESTGPQFVLEI